MNIHFIAIGGSAMHNLALALAKRKNMVVSGSDDAIFEPSKSRLLEGGLLPEKEGWFEEKINSDLDAVILGMHAKKDNPELVKSKALGIKIYSYPEFLYECSKRKTRVVIGGSHGKTSTTSMLLHSLSFSEIDFDFMLGAQLEGYENAVKLSEDSEWAVFEGDEYLSSPIDLRPKFHLYRANVAILTGMAWDHINVFPTKESYNNAFKDFIKSMEPGGTLIYNSEDIELKKLVLEDSSPIRKIPYKTPDYRIKNSKWIWCTPMGDLDLNFMGKHNLSNAEGARWLAQEMGVQADDFYDAISSFKGADRRMQLLNKGDKRLVHLDFAHAPSKVKATVQAYEETYSDKIKIGVLELHTFSSLNVDYISSYQGVLDNLDKAFVFFDPHAIAMKNLKELSRNEVEKTFGQKISVITNIKDLKDNLEILPLSCNLLIMSSGNLGGFDIKSFSKKWVL
tara:strand:- start:2287 stop:3642 length:1356 start_codon:yes stop_codon:yes gene_type:complete